MRILKALGFHKSTAQTAKDRLHIIIAQQRSEQNSPDYLPQLRQEILAVIAKHTKVDIDKINVDLQTKDNNSVVELNVIFPEAT
jgi:cell division topological specificity factor